MMRAIASRITLQPVSRLPADVVSLDGGKNVKVTVPISHLKGKNIVK